MSGSPARPPAVNTSTSVSPYRSAIRPGVSSPSACNSRYPVVAGEMTWRRRARARSKRYRISFSSSGSGPNVHSRAARLADPPWNPDASSAPDASRTSTRPAASSPAVAAIAPLNSHGCRRATEDSRPGRSVMTRTWATLPAADEAQCLRAPGGVAPGVCVQLVQYRGHVAVHRADRQHQAGRDLRVAQPFGEQPDHLDLPVGEPGRVDPGRGHRPARDPRDAEVAQPLPYLVRQRFRTEFAEDRQCRQKIVRRRALGERGRLLVPASRLLPPVGGRPPTPRRLYRIRVRRLDHRYRYPGGAQPVPQLGGPRG